MLNYTFEELDKIESAMSEIKHGGYTLKVEKEFNLTHLQIMQEITYFKSKQQNEIEY